MANYPPNIEILPESPVIPPYPKPLPWYQRHRLTLFAVLFLIFTLASLTYNYSRPAIYRSSATLLTSAMTAIDQNSTEAADAQHVEIQRQTLLSRELLTETANRLNVLTDTPYPDITFTDLQKILRVEPVDNTNLVDIQAEGEKPGFLPTLINTWIEVYQDARNQEILKRTDDTTRIVSSEMQNLEKQVERKRAELELFRQNNEILSTGRDENEAVARLKGLNDALNKANEDAVKTRSRVDAVKSAIANGEAVVPEQDQVGLQDLEKRRQELKEKQSKLQKQFTQSYIDLHPEMKMLPEEIEKIEKAIINKLDYGKTIVLTEAEEDYRAAQQTIKTIRKQLDDHKKEASAFTAVFTKHEAMKSDLEGLEKLLRETQERLAQIQADHKDKYPQLNVINKAYASSTPVRPDYHRDALIATAGSLLAALFIVWMIDYLTKVQEVAPPTMNTTLSSIHLHQSPPPDLLNYQTTNAPPALERRRNQPLLASSASVRELSTFELKLLMDNANLKGKQVIGCLLSGLTVDEISELKSTRIDFVADTIRIGEPSFRTLPLHEVVKDLFNQSEKRPVWEDETPVDLSDLAATLLCAAVDSGLPHPEEITMATIRHSYIAYLVRQGLRLAKLESVVGQLDSAAMLTYSAFSPPQRGKSIEEIELMHPALKFNLRYQRR